MAADPRAIKQAHLLRSFPTDEEAAIAYEHVLRLVESGIREDDATLCERLALELPHGQGALCAAAIDIRARIPGGTVTVTDTEET